MAAVLASGRGAVLSHRSAGRLWKLVPGGDEAIEVTRPRGGRSDRPGVKAHQGPLAADELAELAGIPVTSVSRTLFDLAACVPRHRLERAFNEAEVRRLTDTVSLPTLLERHSGRPGASAIRALLGSRRPAGITRSQLEERFVTFLREYGLPAPRLNVPLHVDGRFWEVDCLWARQRLIVELDGKAFHDTARGFERDRERDRTLLAAGWRVMRITWRQLGDEPDAVAADLRRLLIVAAGSTL